MTMCYQSYARWNPKDVPPGALNSQNETTDEHDTEADAQAVVNLLKRNGFAGEGRVFPIEGGVRLCSHSTETKMGNDFNATKARRLTDEANLVRENSVFFPVLVEVLNKIKATATNGGNRISDVLGVIESARVKNGISGNSHVETAILEELRRRGFQITCHPDPDPGHPCSSAWTEVKW